MVTIEQVDSVARVIKVNVMTHSMFYKDQGQGLQVALNPQRFSLLTKRMAKTIFESLNEAMTIE